MFTSDFQSFPVPLSFNIAPGGSFCLDANEVLGPDEIEKANNLALRPRENDIGLRTDGSLLGKLKVVVTATGFWK